MEIYGNVEVYIDDEEISKKRVYAPYKFEIKMIKDKTFNNNLLNDIKEYYKKFLNLPNNTIELEKQLSFDKTNFENEISRLNSKLQEIKFDITSDAYINFKDKISAVLNANISFEEEMRSKTLSDFKSISCKSNP